MPARGGRWLVAAAVLLGAVLLVAVERPARAQVGEGPGIKISDTLVLHPGISVGTGYDSNLFYASNAFTNDISGGVYYISVRPGLDISTRGAARSGNAPHAVDFRFHAGLPVRALVSTNRFVNRHYSLGVDAGMVLSIFPQGEWSLDLYDNFLRTSDPPYAAVVANFCDNQACNINLDNNVGGLRLRWRPGGQRFEATAQYTFNLYYFEGAALAAKTSVINDFQLRMAWKFFPKTALYLNISETINSYVNSRVNTPPSAYPFRAVLGMKGLISARFAVDLNIGYGNSFTRDNLAYMGNTSYSSVIALAEAEWKPGAFTALALGYRHDFAQALIGTYFDLDGAWLAFNQAIWKFNLGLRLSWERRAYHGNLDKDGLINMGADNAAVNRVDNLLLVHGQIDYPFKQWLYASVGYDFSRNFSNGEYKPASGNVNGLPTTYARHDVWLRMSVAY